MSTLDTSFKKGNKKEVLNQQLVNDVDETPCKVVQDELGYMVTMGNYRLPSYYATLDEAIARIKQTDWELIGLYVYLLDEIKQNENLKNK